MYKLQLEYNAALQMLFTHKLVEDRLNVEDRFRCRKLLADGARAI